MPTHDSSYPAPPPTPPDRRACRRPGWLLLALPLIALGAAAAPPAERLTLEPGVIRTRPERGAQEVLYRNFLDDDTRRLATGTLVLVLGSLGTGGDRAEPWVYVAAPEGVFGWAAQRDLTPFDPLYPDRAYQAILDHRLDAPASSPAVQADFDAWLSRVRAEVPQRYLKHQAGLDDPRRLIARYAEYAQSCRRQAPAPVDPRGRAGAAPHTETLPPRPYIVTASRVRVRQEPESRCGPLPRLALGTLVTVGRRTLTTETIDDIKAPWYQVETRDGTSGWVFGGVLYPFERDRPGPAYAEVWERHLAGAPRSLRAELEFLDLLGRLTPELPPDLAADAALARLRALGRVLALGFPCNDLPPRDALSLADAPDLAARFGDARAYVTPAWEQGPPRLNPGAYWALHERYRGQPPAERLAWAASRADAEDPVDKRAEAECEEWSEGVGEDDATPDPNAIIRVLANEGVLRYLALYPQGAHADAALAVLEEALEGSARLAQDDPGAPCRPPLRARLGTTLGVLGPLAGTRAAAARTRIDRLQTGCPVAQTTAGSGAATPAGGGDTAAGMTARMQVGEVLAMAGMIKAAVMEAYMSRGQFPADNAAAGLPEPERLIGNYLTGIRVADGAIHLTFGNHADPGLLGQVLTLRPAVVTDSPGSPGSWLCGYLTPVHGMTAVGANLTSVLPRDLPTQCRDTGP